MSEEKKIIEKKEKKENLYTKSYGYKNPCPQIPISVFNTVLKTLVHTGAFKIDDPRHTPFRHTEDYQPPVKECPALADLVMHLVTFIRTTDTCIKLHGNADAVMGGINSVSASLFSEAVSSEANVAKCCTDPFTAMQSINPIVAPNISCVKKRKLTNGEEPKTKRKKTQEVEEEESSDEEIEQ